MRLKMVHQRYILLGFNNTEEPFYLDFSNWYKSDV